MAGMILRKTGVVLLTILKGLLHAVLMILKLLCMGLKWVCQVKCVSSFLHLFPQPSAVEGADRNSGHGGDLFVGIAL